MPLTKQLIQNGDGINFPKVGDSIGVNFTSWLYKSGAADNRGRRSVEDTSFFSELSIDRRAFRIDGSPANQMVTFVIGESFMVEGETHKFISYADNILGWNQAILQMSLGEHTVWTVPRWVGSYLCWIWSGSRWPVAVGWHILNSMCKIDIAYLRDTNWYLQWVSGPYTTQYRSNLVSTSSQGKVLAVAELIVNQRDSSSSDQQRHGVASMVHLTIMCKACRAMSSCTSCHEIWDTNSS